MRHIVISLFGFQTIFAGVCTMAHAQTIAPDHGEQVLMCHAAGLHPGAAACNSDATSSARVMENGCTDGSCIIKGAMEERILVNENGVPRTVVAALPAGLFESSLTVSWLQAVWHPAYGRAPPGSQRSLVLRL